MLSILRARSSNCPGTTRQLTGVTRKQVKKTSLSASSNVKNQPHGNTVPSKGGKGEAKQETFKDAHCRSCRLSRDVHAPLQRELALRRIPEHRLEAPIVRHCLLETHPVGGRVGGCSAAAASALPLFCEDREEER